MSAITLTLVMPVYNGIAFIEQSLITLLTQMKPGIEVIVVDDGSVDGTSDRIFNRFKKYIEAGILVLHVQKNQGVSAARNFGIAQARGQYIGFIDADDIVLSGYISNIINAISQNVDIIEFGFKTFTANVNETDQANPMYSNEKFGQTNIETIIDHVHAIARWYPWSRVFKADLLTSIRFPVGVRFCEDLMTIPALYEKAKTIIVLEKALYGYRINQNSATYNVSADYIEKLIAFYYTIPKSGMTI